MKKKILSTILAIMFLLTACASNGGSQTSKKNRSAVENNSNKKFKIGIVQLLEHKALDDARIGFIEEIKNLGIDAEFIEKNAQGTIDNARVIVESFVDEKVDLIFAIATPVAQAAMSVTKDIPILFSAVTDPVNSGLVNSKEKPGANITGTSDFVDIKNQISLFKEINKDIKNIGVIYSQDEDNSLAQINILKTILPEMGFNLETMAIQNLSDLPQVSESLISKVDAVYVITDNKIASSVSLVAKKLIEQKKPSIAAESALVEGGILLTNGISYKNLGGQTAQMAKKILVDKVSPSEISVEESNTLDKIVNEATLSNLNLDKNMDVFKDSQFIK